MPRSMLLLFTSMVLVAGGCAQGEEQESPAASADAAAGVAGLYERAGRTGAADRICLAGQDGALRFGLATGSDGPGNCTARGTAVRDGGSLRLQIDGAPACRLSATMSAAAATLATPEGAECSYYCGEGAELTPGLFAKVGGSDATGRAVDAAGEPLCS